MQSLIILLVSSVMLKTISATEVSLKRTEFLHFACWFKFPNNMVFYTNLCYKQWETAIWLQFNSHVTLATVSSWLRTTHHEKPAKSACKCFALKGTTAQAQYCTLSLQSGGGWPATTILHGLGYWEMGLPDCNRGIPWSVKCWWKDKSGRSKGVFDVTCVLSM